MKVFANRGIRRASGRCNWPRDGTVRPVPCRRLAEEGQMPERFLLQILRSLVKRGIWAPPAAWKAAIGSERQPAEISLLDVIEAMDGPLNRFCRASSRGFPKSAKGKLECVLVAVSPTVTRREFQAVNVGPLLPRSAGTRCDCPN